MINTSEDEKSHVDHNVTSSFKVTREGHAIGNSWNDFLWPKKPRKQKKNVHHSSTTTTRIRNHALKYDAFDVIDDVIGVTWHLKNILQPRLG